MQNEFILFVNHWMLKQYHDNDQIDSYKFKIIESLLVLIGTTTRTAVAKTAVSIIM